MYRQGVQQLIDELAETEAFFRAGIVAIDLTEVDPYPGDRTGYEDETIGTKEKNDGYAYQWATVQLVGNAVPLVLDARPVRPARTSPSTPTAATSTAATPTAGPGPF